MSAVSAAADWAASGSNLAIRYADVYIESQQRFESLGVRGLDALGDSFTKDDVDRVAGSIVAELGHDLLRQAAFAWVVRAIVDARRTSERAIEHRAVTARHEAELHLRRDAERQAKLQAQKDAKADEFERANPGKFYDRSLDYHGWAGVTYGDCECDPCESGRQRELARNKRFRDQMRKVTDEYERELRVRWTAELLGSTFALPGGEITTWGRATADQHRRRIEMLQSQMVGTGKSCALHVKALHTIEEAGVATLAAAIAEDVTP